MNRKLLVVTRCRLIARTIGNCPLSFSLLDALFLSSGFGLSSDVPETVTNVFAVPAVGVGIFVVEIVVGTFVTPNMTCLNHVCSFSSSTLAKLATELQRRSSDPSPDFSVVLNNALKNWNTYVLNCDET